VVRLSDIPEPERTLISEMDCPSYGSTPYTKAMPALEQHVAIVSTAGLIVRGERPLLARDPGYRSLASDVADGDILCSHVSTNFDRTGFQQDLNVVFPRQRLMEFELAGRIGKAANTHYSFMGATNPDALRAKAKELAGSMLALGVNTVVLAPVCPACTRAVCALAHFFEEEGLATTVIALVRKHAVLVRPPRAIWVPFELGRPFGGPNNTIQQTQVLQAALDLLEETGPGPVLKDFPVAEETDRQEDAWNFPGKLEANDVLAEVRSVQPLWEQACQRNGRTTVGISGHSPNDALFHRLNAR